METDDIQALFTRVNDDPALQARFKTVTDETEFDALISELGYDITYADFAEAAQDVELSDTELAEVAGGELITTAVALGATAIVVAGTLGVVGGSTAAGFGIGTVANNW